MNNVQKFLEENKKHPVISGRVIEPGGRGAIYTLDNGSVYRLTRKECEEIGHPDWGFGK